MSTDPNYPSVVTVQIPNNPTLVGTRVYHQWLWFNPGQPLSAWRMSRGVQVEVNV